MCKSIKRILCIFLFWVSLNDDLIISGFDVEKLQKVMKLPLWKSLPPPFGMVINGFSFMVDAMTPEQEVTLENVVSELKDIHTAIDRIEKQLKLQSETMIDQIVERQESSIIEQKIKERTNLINDWYKDMTMDLYKFDNATLLVRAIDYSRHTTESLLSLLRLLVDELIPSDLHNQPETILRKISKQASQKLGDGQWCDNPRSFNGYIAHRYKVFCDTITKGYVLMVGSCTFRRLLSGEDTVNETLAIVEEYFSVMRTFSDEVGELIANSSLSVRRCDPPEHERGKTFIEFEKLIQGYLVHKTNLKGADRDSIIQLIYPDCETLKVTKWRPAESSYVELTWFDQTKCSGNMYDCTNARVTSVCPATTPSRRYEGFAAGSNIFEPTPNRRGNMTCKDDQLRKLFKSYGEPLMSGLGSGIGLITSLGMIFGKSAIQQRKLESCGCLCDDPSDRTSFRLISTTPVWSDTDNNMVITGFRLVNDSNILRLQIKQGKLEKYGFIDKSSNGWKNSAPASYDQRFRKIQLSMGLRSINLNMATAPPGFAIVGAEFTLGPGVDNSRVIQLGIYTLPVLYSSGELASPSMHLSWHTPERPKSELTINEPTIPTLAFRNKLITGKDKFIKLQASDWKKDAAQTVVPFLDIREVVTDPPALLGGLGFSYRSEDGYGGFLGLELQTWNYTTIFFNQNYNDTDLFQRSCAAINHTESMMINSVRRMPLFE